MIWPQCMRYDMTKYSGMLRLPPLHHSAYQCLLRSNFRSVQTKNQFLGCFIASPCSLALTDSSSHRCPAPTVRSGAFRVSRFTETHQAVPKPGGSPPQLDFVANRSEPFWTLQVGSCLPYVGQESSDHLLIGSVHEAQRR